MQQDMKLDLKKTLILNGNGRYRYLDMLRRHLVQGRLILIEKQDILKCTISVRVKHRCTLSSCPYPPMSNGTGDRYDQKRHQMQSLWASKMCVVTPELKELVVSYNTRVRLVLSETGSKRHFGISILFSSDKFNRYCVLGQNSLMLILL